MSLRPCRKCVWKQATSGTYDGNDYVCDHRSEKTVLKMYTKYRRTGSVEAGYELKGGQALLRLRSFDTMKDCPVEMLHTIMLGVGKSLVRCLLNEKDFLIPLEKALLETRLFGFASSGFSRRLRSSLRLHRSFLGRDFKIVMQQLPLVLLSLLASGDIVDRTGGLGLISNCFDNLG